MRPSSTDSQRAPEQLTLFDKGANVTKLRESAARLKRFTTAPNTTKAYESDWGIFHRWCIDAGRKPLPASEETITLFTAAEIDRGARPSSTSRRLNAITARHKQAGHTRPSTTEARQILKGAQREDRRPSRAKKAITIDDLRKIAAALSGDSSRKSVRDRALILFGFASGMRESELVALEHPAHIEYTTKGIRATIAKSKTDQKRAGREVGIHRAKSPELCPVKAIAEWMRLRGSAPGPLFTHVRPFGKIPVGEGPLTADYVAHIVQLATARIGLNPKHYAGHSLRSGMVTAALESGAPDAIIMQHTGHRSHAMMQRYHRPVDAMLSNPLAKAL